METNEEKKSKEEEKDTLNCWARCKECGDIYIGKLNTAKCRICGGTEWSGLSITFNKTFK